MPAEKADPLIYTLRPNNTALWLPETLTWELGIKRGDKLTPEQMSSRQIFSLLEKRLAKKAKPEKE